MKLNNPLPQALPKECNKAAKICRSFVDSGNNGLDGVIPKHILENARGFAIFSIFKAGFLFSARAGSGLVIARLDDGSWSAPSAIGLAGVGVGGQAGAEITDFLIVLNSKSAIRQFMAAGSLTLGGNMSLAVGPLGRNGEASGALNSSGKVAAMYSYSKTRGLFGGLSVEGSVIVERQDANAQAYHSDVTSKQLLSGSVTPPDWASTLIRTLDSCTGPVYRNWVEEGPGEVVTPLESPYAFNGISSPPGERPSSGMGTRGISAGRGTGTGAGMGKKVADAFPPASWGRRKSGGSYFSQAGGARGDAYDDHDDVDGLSGAMGHASLTGATKASGGRGGTYDNGLRSANSESWDYDRPPKVHAEDDSSTSRFGEHFESDFVPPATHVGRSSLTGSTNSTGGGGRQRFADWQPEHHPQSKSMGAIDKRTFAPSPSSSLGMNHQRSSSNSYGAPQSKLAQRSSFYDDSLGKGSGPGLGGNFGSRSPIYGGSVSGRKEPEFDGFRDDDEIDDPFSSRGEDGNWGSGKKKIEPKRELARPLTRDEGVARAIALFDFKAVQAGDLSFTKGQVITITEKSDSTDTWWKGKLDGRQGSFPANFVEVV